MILLKIYSIIYNLYKVKVHQCVENYSYYSYSSY